MSIAKPTIRIRSVERRICPIAAVPSS